MSKLVLLDENKAGIFGVPAQDTDTDAVIQSLLSQGWTADAALRHLNAAVTAGVYRREDHVAHRAKAKED